MSKKVFYSLIFISLLFFQSCSSDKQETSDNKDVSINVVVTTNIVGDLVKVIGGDKVKIDVLMNPGVDPHAYKATEGDVNRMFEADAIIYNGLHLEGKMTDIFEKLSASKPTFGVADNLDSRELIKAEDVEYYDPHVWMSVSLWKEVSYEVMYALIEIDPFNKSNYMRNNAEYVKSLDELNSWIKNEVKAIPEEKRYLITAHDAFNYFGKAYNFEVIGIQGINTQEETGTNSIQNLSDLIIKNKIPAIFIETSVSEKFIKALQESVNSGGDNVSIGGELYSDSLGDEKSGAGNYINMMKHNVSTIVNSLKDEN